MQKQADGTSNLNYMLAKASCLVSVLMPLVDSSNDLSLCSVHKSSGAIL
jgi:hypothetical protein